MNRRNFLKTAAIVPAAAVAVRNDALAAVGPNDKIKVTKIESFVLKNSWVFVKVSTDAGITGWGEMLKDDAKACAAGALEVSHYLVGQDPTRIQFHWQAIQRGAFYRGGPIKSAIQSGIDQALWDITGKVHGVPVWKLLGGNTRDKVRVYGTPNSKTGVTAMKVILSNAKGRNAFKYNEGELFVGEVCERFKALREKNPGVDIGVEFHGAVQPPTAMRLMKALEPYNPWFYEEIAQALNVDVMAEMARKTHIPIATGERIFLKWGFREILGKTGRPHSAAGCLLRGRHQRTAQYRSDGGGILFADCAAQSAGSVFAGGELAGCSRSSELPHPGTRRQ